MFRKRGDMGLVFDSDRLWDIMAGLSVAPFTNLV